MDWTFLVATVLFTGALCWLLFDSFAAGVVGGIVLFFLAGRKG